MRGRLRFALAGPAAAALLVWVACAGVGVPDLAPEAPNPHASRQPDARAAEPLLARVRQLTFVGRRSGEGYFGVSPRPDSTSAGDGQGPGERLIFQSEREPGNPFYQIYLMNLATGDVDRMSTGVGKTTCGWIHPDGRRVLYASTHHDPEAKAKQAAELTERESGKQRRYSWDYDPNYDLFTSETSASRYAAPKRITAEWGYDAEASWSPDGRTIAWASNRHAYAMQLSPEDQQRLATDPAYFMEIYLSDGDGGSPRRLTHTPGYDGGPFFSPDGDSIVWRRFSPDGAKAEIYTMQLSDDAVRQGIRQLTRLDAMSWAPFFHPSGDYVIFASNLEGFANFELYVVDAKGHRDPVRVTHRDGFDGLPAFSPDGKRLAWTSGRTPDGKSQIFLADWDDAEARRLLGLPYSRGSGVKALLPVPKLSPDVSEDDLRAHVAALTSDPADGRLTGSAGARIATGYVARVFRSIGLSPAGDQQSYFQDFGFVAGVSLGEDNFLGATHSTPSDDSAPTSGPSVSSASSTSSSGEKRNLFEAAPLVVDQDWRPLAFSNEGTMDSAAVVFGGYGIVAPASDHTPELDAYAELDVADKWVLVLRYVPEGLSPPARQHLHRYSSLRYKAMLARDRGARGILIASGPRSKVRHQLAKLAFDTSLSGSSLTVISITDAVAEGLLSRSGRDLAGLQAEFDNAKGDAKGFPLEGVEVHARVDLQHQRSTGRNVLARLRASTGQNGDGATVPALVIGAHVDHLGRGEGQGSLARGDEEGRIHRGADDNASGVAALLEVAQELAIRSARGEIHLQRDVIFAAWDGEELGLLGSSHFVNAFGSPHDESAKLSLHVAAYLNMDMVGRLREELLLYGVASSSVWPRLIEASNAPLGVPVVGQPDNFLPSDSTPFAARAIPGLAAFTGVHSEYHSPRDTLETLNLAGLTDIAKLVAQLAAGVAEMPLPPDYVPQTKPSKRGARASFRAYLGTIPDYAASGIHGLMLSGVASGGPAEQAGLRARDIVVELAGRRIENIYDYTFALEALEIGVEVEIIVERNGETLALKLTPASRD